HRRRRTVRDGDDRVVREPPLRRLRRRIPRRRRGPRRGHRARPPRARPQMSAAVAWIAAATTALHVVTANVWDFHRDEFYYLACGRPLAWGYVAPPPHA